MSDWHRDLGQLLQLAGQTREAAAWLAAPEYEDAYELCAQRLWTPSGDFTWQLSLEDDYALTGNLLWDLPEATPVELDFQRGWLTGPDRMLATRDQHWQLWDLSRHRPHRRFAASPEIKYLSEVWAIGQRLAIWQNDNILFFDLGSGQLVWQSRGYKIMGQLPESEAVVVSRFKSPSGLYRLQDGLELAPLPEDLTAFARGAAGYVLGCPQSNWTYHAWEDGRVLARAQEVAGPSPSWLHLPGQQQLLVASGSKLTRWSLEDGSLMQDFGACLRTHSGQNLTASRDGRLVLAVCQEGLAVYSSASGRLLQFFRSPNEGHCRVAVSPNDRWLVCCLGNEVHFYQRLRRNSPSGDAAGLLQACWPRVRPYRSQCLFALSRRHPELRSLSSDCQPYRDHRQWVWAAVSQRRWHDLAHFPPGRIWPGLLECPDDEPLLELLSQELPPAWCQNLALLLVDQPRPGLVAGLRRHPWPEAWLPLLDWLEGKPAGDLRPLLEQLQPEQARRLRQQLVQRQQLSLINRWENPQVGSFSPSDWAELLSRIQPQQLRSILPRLPLRRSLPLLKDLPGPWEDLLEPALRALQPELLAEIRPERHRQNIALCPGRVDFAIIGARASRLFFERQWRDWPDLVALAADPRGPGLVLATRTRVQYWDAALTEMLWSTRLKHPHQHIQFYFPPNGWIAVLSGPSHEDRCLALHHREDGRSGWCRKLKHPGGDLQIDQRGAFFEYRWLDWEDGKPRPIQNRNSEWTLRGQPTHLYVRHQACSPSGNWWAAASSYGEVVLSQAPDQVCRSYRAPEATGNISLLLEDQHSLLGCNGDFWEARSGELLLSLRDSWLQEYAYEGRRSRLAVASNEELTIWRLIDPRPLQQISPDQLQQRLNWAYPPDEKALWTLAARLREELR
ncbi:hypothetical protein JST97_09300 [bacterium]|nr:hypothetical protein [bacterium]